MERPAPSPRSDAWLPPTPDALRSTSGGAGVDRGWLLKVGGVVVALVAVAALLTFLPDADRSSDDDGDRRASASSQAPLDELRGVCAGRPQPIERAATFDGEPGPHRIETVSVLPADGSIDAAPRRFEGDPDPVAGSPADIEDLRFEELELVGCYVVTDAAPAMDCDFETFGTGATFTQQRWVTSGRLVVREAKTGREVLRQDVPAAADVACPDAAVASKPRSYQDPDDAILAVMRIYSGG